jgi:hypothetical protein
VQQITSYPCVVFTDANNHTTTYGYSGVEVLEVIDGNGNLESTSYTPDAKILLHSLIRFNMQEATLRAVRAWSNSARATTIPIWGAGRSRIRCQAA